MIATITHSTTDAGTLHTAVVKVLSDLHAAGIPDPLAATISVGALLRDLYRAANLPVPIGPAAWAGDLDDRT